MYAFDFDKEKQLEHRSRSSGAKRTIISQAHVPLQPQKRTSTSVQ